MRTTNSKMGFKAVNQCLIEMFPQVDPRILRAVAIEHSKDADAAAELVVLDILPLLKTKPVNSKPLDSSTNILINQPKEHKTPNMENNRKRLGKEVDDSEAEAEAGSSGISKVDKIPDLIDIENVESQVKSNLYREESLILLPVVDNVSEKPDIDIPNEKSVHEETLQSTVDDEANPITLTNDSKYIDSEYERESLHTDKKEENVDELLFFKDQEDDLNDSSNFNCSILLYQTTEDVENFKTTVDAWSEDNQNNDEEFPVKEDAFDASSNLNDPIPVLDETIDHSKNNKKMLFAAMELVLNMMREAEGAEMTAQVEEQETTAISLVSDTVENMKQMIEDAKQENNVHAGEVYGEKLILATEARELQGRLFTLSAERDSAMSALDQMRRRLQGRISAADSAYNAARLKNIEKEKIAGRALQEQEALMELVKKESKMLEKESEENSKMREFLVEKGRIVDTLQGEISVICEDVKALKEKFDMNMPLDLLVSSSQTSCLLASSYNSSDAEKVIDLEKDDDWEMFDKPEV